MWDNNISIFLQCNINKLESVQRRAARFVCHDYQTDIHRHIHVTETLLGLSTTATCSESGCFTAYTMVWLQYHLISSSRPQLLPEDTKPATCTSDATPVCTARRSFQAQSDYGTVYLQKPATSHLTASSWSCRRLISSDHALKFLSHRTARFYFLS